MRKILDQKFWSHGTPLGFRGPPGQTDASQKCSPGDSGSHYGTITHWDSPVDGAFLPLLRTSPDICVRLGCLRNLLVDCYSVISLDGDVFTRWLKYLGIKLHGEGVELCKSSFYENVRGRIYMRMKVLATKFPLWKFSREMCRRKIYSESCQGRGQGGS